METFTGKAFYGRLGENKLTGSRCEACKALHVPPRPMWPSCLGADMLLEDMSGDGKLIAFTTVHIAPTAMIEAGYGRQNPYCVGVVRLAEGPAISAQIVGVDPTSPEEIRIGTPGPGYLYRQRRRRGRHEVPRFRTARLEPPSNAPPVLMGV